MALQPYPADPRGPSASAAPSYFTAAAIRAGYAVAAPPPPAANWNALHRELHDERVREDYFAREIARSHSLLDQRRWHPTAPIYPEFGAASVPSQRVERLPYFLDAGVDGGPGRTEFGAASVLPQRGERLPYSLEAGVDGRPVERQLGYTRTPAALRPEAVIRKQRPLVNGAVVSRAESTLPQKSSGIRRKGWKAATAEALQKLSGIEREAATTEAVNDPPQEVKKWKCSLCRTFTTSEKDLKSHFRGQRHKAVQESEQELKNKAVQESRSSESKVADKSLPEDGPKEVNKKLSKKVKVKRWSCSICRVFTHSEIDLKNHLQGQKHKAVQESEQELKSYLQGQKPKAVQESRSSESKVADKSLPADGLKEVNKQLSTNIAKEADGLKEVDKQLSTNIANIAKEADGLKEVDKQLSTNTAKEYFFCDICKLQCNSQSMLNGHLNGKKHKEILFNSQLKVREMTNKQGLIAKKQKATHESHGSQPKVADKVLPVDGSKQVNKLLSTNHVPEKQKYFCEVCNVKCTSQSNVSSHLDGKRHKEALTLLAKGPDIVTSAGTSEEVDKETKPGVEQKQVLKSKRKSLTDLKSPLNGKKLKASEDNKLDKPALLEVQSFNCDACNLRCNSLSNLKLHLNGKRHKAQLEELNKVQDDKLAIAEQSGEDGSPVSVEESGEESKAVNAAEPATAEQSGDDKETSVKV